MQINKDVIEGKWTEIKGEIQKTWGRLTDSELEKTKGDLKAIKGIIQQKYGESKGEHESKIEEIMNKLKTKKDEAVDQVKAKLKK